MTTTVDSGYIFVDEDYNDVIRVYPASEDFDHIPAKDFYFEKYDSRADCRRAAEQYAERQAKKYGCGWGCNY